MNKKLFNLAVLVAFTLQAAGCATIFQPGPDRIPVRTEPEGAKVYLNGAVVGETPTVVSVYRADDCSIEIKKDGFQTVRVDRDKVVAGWVFGNILLGGVIGLTVDLIGHNQGKHSEDPIFYNLNPAIAAAETKAPAAKSK